VRSFAANALRVSEAALPHDVRELAEAVAAESMRIGLHTSYANQGPVHQLQLRSWLQRKLEPFLPELSKEGRYDNVVQMLLAKPGPIGFLGDVLVLENGFLAPGPLRALPLAPEQHVLLGGAPAYTLGPLARKIRFAGITRHIINASEEEVVAAGIPIVDHAPNTTLRAGAAFDPKIVLLEALRGSRGMWAAWDDWEGYVGNAGFPGFVFIRDSFTSRGRRPIEVDVDGSSVSVWKERRGHDGERYWLRTRRGVRTEGILLGHKLPAKLLLAVDDLSGKPRFAAIEAAAQDKVRLSLPLQPSGDLYRWLRLVGAQSVQAGRDTHQYDLPKPMSALTRALVQAMGIRVRPGGA
jgi:hypothetical protein